MSALAQVADDTLVEPRPKIGCVDTACPCESPFWDEEKRACDACGRVTETTRVRINLKGGPALCSACF